MLTTKKQPYHAADGAALLSSVREAQTGTLVYHFVGIGGCGMSGLAQMLRQQGHRVTGSDMQGSAVVERLVGQGIGVTIGHDAGVIPGNVDCLVVSAAIKPDNPELVWARRAGLPVCKYAELLGHLSRRISTLAVAGTHGKSTSTAWLAYMLAQAGRDPSFVVGAEVDQLAGPSGAGRGEYLVVEACEYDRSFLNLRPHVAAILNIEADHLDYYRDVDEIVTAFRDFALLLGEGGLLIANADDVNVRRGLGEIDVQCQWFSMTGPADWQVANVEYHRGRAAFELLHQGRSMGRVKLPLAGRHNVANALAVAAMGKSASLDDQQICRALESFAGVRRRMSYKGRAGGVVILDDYAHHPTEIRVTLEAIASEYQPRRLWCVFQPHQHSRTRFLLSEFASSFTFADVVLIPDIYFVRDSEQLRRDISADELVREIVTQQGEARYLPDFQSILDCLCDELRQGDLVVTMGAGDIWKLADELIRRLGRDR